MFRRLMFAFLATLLVLVTGIGATSTAAPDGTVSLCLPSVLSPAIPPPPEEVCRLFADDFSDPSSGWPVGYWPDYSFSYDAGEYRVLHRRRVETLSAHPAIDWPTNAFSAGVDIRWEGEVGNFYGFYVSTVETTGRISYVVSVNARTQQFSVVRWSGGLPQTSFLLPIRIRSTLQIRPIESGLFDREMRFVTFHEERTALAQSAR